MISAALKNAIDWVSRPDSEDEKPLSAIAGKTAAIISASPGGYGGSRSLGFLLDAEKAAWSIPHADADRFRGFYDLALGLDEMEFVDCVLDGDGIDMV